MYKDTRHKSKHQEAHIYPHSEGRHVIYTEKMQQGIQSNSLTIRMWTYLQEKCMF